MTETEAIPADRDEKLRKRLTEAKPSHFLRQMRRRLAASRVQQLESWDIVAFAAGDEGAVQIKVRVKGEPGDDERAEVQRFAISTYRYCFGEWATNQGLKLEEIRRRSPALRASPGTPAAPPAE